MRRADLINAIRRVALDIVQNDMETALQLVAHGIRAERSSPDWFNLTAVHRYLSAVSSYGPPEHALMDAMQISEIQAPSFWQNLLAGDVASEDIFKLNNQVDITINQIPKIVELIERDSDRISSRSLSPNDFLNGKSLFTFILPEAPGTYSSPARAAYLFEGVLAVYETLSEISGLDGRDLAFIACDSGSDKVFDFAGSGEIVRELKEIFTSLWDRIVFFKQHTHNASIESLSETLDVVAKISKMEDDEIISRERAEILRRNLFKGIDKIFDSGAVTPEMDSRDYEKARLVLQPRPKLLAAPATSTADVSSDASSGADSEITGDSGDQAATLSADDVESIRQLLARLPEGLVPRDETPKPSTRKAAPTGSRKRLKRPSEG